MKVIDEVSKKFKLNELGQGSRQIKFAIINRETGHTVTPFCKCKDYFTDLFWSRATKKDVDVCGFKWKADDYNEAFSSDVLSIAVKIITSSKQEELNTEQADKIQKLLNKFEKANKMKLSKVSLSENDHLILDVPMDWTKKPYLVSALFLIIRLGLNYDGKTEPIEYYSTRKSKDFVSPYDEGYFKTVKNKLQDLLNGKIDKKQTYEMYASGSIIHSSGGIVGYRDYSV